MKKIKKIKLIFLHIKRLEKIHLQQILETCFSNMVKVYLGVNICNNITENKEFEYNDLCLVKIANYLKFFYIFV